MFYTLSGKENVVDNIVVNQLQNWMNSAVATRIDWIYSFSETKLISFFFCQDFIYYYFLFILSSFRRKSINNVFNWALFYSATDIKSKNIRFSVLCIASVSWEGNVFRLIHKQIQLVRFVCLLWHRQTTGCIALHQPKWNSFTVCAKLLRKIQLKIILFAGK